MTHSTDNTPRPERSFLTLASVSTLGVVLLLIGVIVVRGMLAGGGPKSASGASPNPLSAEAVEAVLDSARVYLKKGEPGKAQAILREAIEQDQYVQDLRTLYAEVLLGEGLVDEAYSQYLHAIAIGPVHAELHFAAGVVANKTGSHIKAEEHFWQAQSLAPSNPKHPIYLAQVQRNTGKVDEAKKSLIIAGKLDPNVAVVWGTLAGIALDENKLSVAAGHIRRARELEPSSLTWRLLEAKIIRRGNDPEAALTLLNALPERERLSNKALLEEIALCYGMLSKPEAPARLYGAAVEANPNDLDLLMHAAEWNKRAGQRDVALTYARRAHRLGHQEAQAFVDSLE